MQAIATDPTEKTDVRRVNRMPINLPLKVEGKDTLEEDWDEITRLRDVSAHGAGFTLSRPVKRGRLVRITVPMPRQMRCYDFFEAQYNVWGIVRRCIPIAGNVSSSLLKSSSYLIGVAFIGKMPPRSYNEDPSKVYEILNRADDAKGLWEIRNAAANPDESNLPKEDRRHSRLSIPVGMDVDVIGKDGAVRESEPTVSENISLGGASIFTSLTVDVGSFLQITSNQYQTTIKAIVRGRRLGPDGIPRLHIEFIDHFFPLSGIEI